MSVRIELWMSQLRYLVSQGIGPGAKHEGLMNCSVFEISIACSDEIRHKFLERAGLGL